MSFQNLPIRRKVSLVILLMLTVSFAAATVGVFLTSAATFKHRAAAELKTLAELIAVGVNSAVFFDDAEEAAGVLHRLRAQSNIREAHVFKKEAGGWKIFARSPAEAIPPAPSAVTEEGVRFAGEITWFVSELKDDHGRPFARLAVISGLNDLRDEQNRYAAVLMTVMAAMAGLSFALAFYLKKTITDPISALAATAHIIAERRDHTIRAPQLGTDEVGLLAHDFNRMLDVLKERSAELAENEERYRLLIENSGELIAELDEAGVCLYANVNFTSQLGHAPAEIIRHSYFDFVHPDEAPGLRGKLQGEFFSGHFRARHRDGSWRWMEGSGHRFKTSSGDRRWVLISRDITERQRAEETLRASEERFRAVIDHTPHVAVQWYDEQGRVLFWNRASEQCFGWKREEALGKTLDQLIHTAEEAAAFLPVLQEMKITRQPVGPAECGFHRRDGRSGVCLSTLFCIPDLQGGTSFVCMDVDVTERKHAEEEARRLAAFPQLNPNPVLELTASGSVNYCNAAASELAQDLGFPNPAAMLPPDTAAMVRECLETKTSRVRLELPTGQRLLSWSFYPVPAQQVVHCYAADMTERRRLEEQVRQAQKMEAIGQLAGGIAHDFNNILAAIIPYTEMAMEDAGGNDQVAEHLSNVIRAAERAKGLVDQILSCSRHQEQQRSLMPLAPLITEVLKLIRSVLPSTIEIVTHLDPQAPSVLAHAGQIHQVLMNLCANAGHAMRGRVGQLSVSLDHFVVDADFAAAHHDLRAGHYARIAVMDTGHGMAEDVLQRIFDPFFTTKGPGEGTGLGLSVVHGIVTAHGGAIRVYSRPGEGTSFHIFLPGMVSSAAAPAASEKRTTPDGQGQHILFVDDEEAICFVAKRFFSRHGYKITACNDPRKGLELFRANPSAFDLLITDLTMPRLTGFDLAAEAIKIRPRFPIILSSGFIGNWPAEQMARLGIRQVILKPLSMAEYLQVIHAVFQDQAVRPG